MHKFILFIFVYFCCGTYFLSAISSKQYVQKFYLPTKSISKANTDALKFYKKGDCKKAYPLMQKIRTNNADNFYFHYIYGQCAKKLKKYSQAASAFERALILKNNAAGVRLELAKMYLKTSNFIEAQILIANMVEYASNEKIRQDLKDLLGRIDKKKQDHYFKITVGFDAGTDSNIINQAHDGFYIYPNWQYFSDEIRVANNANSSFAIYQKGTQVGATVADRSSPYHVERFSASYTKNKAGSSLYLKSHVGYSTKQATAANYNAKTINYDFSAIIKNPTFAIGGEYLGLSTSQNVNSLKKDLKHSQTSSSFRLYYSVIGEEFVLTAYTKTSSNLLGIDKIPTSRTSLGAVFFGTFFKELISSSVQIGLGSEKVKNQKLVQMFTDDPDSIFVKDEISHSFTSLSGSLSLKFSPTTSFFGNLIYNSRQYKEINWLYSVFNDLTGDPNRYKLVIPTKRRGSETSFGIGFSHIFNNDLFLASKIGYKVNKSNIPLYKYEKTFLQITFQRSFNW